MKYKLKYDLNISCDEFVKINQHKFLPSYFYCSIFYKKTYVANVHKKVHPFFSSTFSSINIIHPWIRGKIFLHITKYSIPCVKKILQIFHECGQNILKKIWSCSLLHAHLLTLMVTCSQNSIPIMIYCIFG